MQFLPCSNTGKLHQLCIMWWINKHVSARSAVLLGSLFRKIYSPRRSSPPSTPPPQTRESGGNRTRNKRFNSTYIFFQNTSCNSKTNAKTIWISMVQSFRFGYANPYYSFSIAWDFLIVSLSRIIDRVVMMARGSGRKCSIALHVYVLFCDHLRLCSQGYPLAHTQHSMCSRNIYH